VINLLYLICTRCKAEVNAGYIFSEVQCRCGANLNLNNSIVKVFYNPLSTADPAGDEFFNPCPLYMMGGV
jgi:hypothetical protein